MTALAFDYYIRSRLPAHPDVPAVLAEKFLATLDALTRIDPMIFADWEVTDLPAVSSIPLSAARLRIAALIENNVARDDYDRPEPFYGYAAVAHTDVVVDRRRMTVRIKAGGEDEGETSLRAGAFKAPPDPAIVTYPLFKAALLAINAILACAVGVRAGVQE